MSGRVGFPHVRLKRPVDTMAFASRPLGPLLLRDELAVARRVLEGGEADRRGAPPPRAPPAGRDRGRRAHEPAEDERPDAAAPAVLVHGGIVGSAACGSARSETSCST